MKAERAFEGEPIAALLSAVETLVAARERCAREWPDTCPVVALWRTPETLISEPYRLLESALPAPWTSIPAYSDHRTATKADILALFDRAIENCR
jgi:hypothetical protein